MSPFVLFGIEGGFVYILETLETVNKCGINSNKES